MQKPKIKPIFFSIVGGVIISILFLMITFWIFYTYSTSPAAAKDALSTTASFFGGVATLWAACIAAYLFHDWKDQHNKNIDAQFCIKIYDFIDSANFDLITISGFLKDYFHLSDNDKKKYREVLKENGRNLLNLKDRSSVVLSNLGYFINKVEYEKKYLPQIINIDKNLDIYIKIYENHLNGAIYKGEIKDVENKIDNLMIDTRNRYRAFIVELSKYYKA